MDERLVRLAVVDLEKIIKFKDIDKMKEMLENEGYSFPEDQNHYFVHSKTKENYLNKYYWDGGSSREPNSFILDERKADEKLVENIGSYLKISSIIKSTSPDYLVITHPERLKAVEDTLSGYDVEIEKMKKTRKSR
ncbi:hypothetical protein KY366_03090 [Candidatus Woesearchaeota archaeon]|nr:hypothetical protein [Candidatus Woesearchaeota archaeon]